MCSKDVLPESLVGSESNSDDGEVDFQYCADSEIEDSLSEDD